MPISTDNDDLFRAILAMDTYNRGYNAGLGDPNTGLAGTQIGLATIRRDIDLPGGAQAASFFAQAYTLGGKTIISYRGTVDDNVLSPSSDIRQGWVTGAGAAGGAQVDGALIAAMRAGGTGAGVVSS